MREVFASRSPRTVIRPPSTLLSVLLLALGLAVVGLGPGAANGAPGGVTAALSCTPNPAQSGDTVTLDAGGSSTEAVGATITSYSFNNDDGGGGSGGSPTDTHPYGAGSYHPSVTVTDDQGNADTASCSLTVDPPPPPPNQPPTAVITFSPGSPVAGSTVTFDGTNSHDPDNDNLSYSWTFDGSSAGSGKTFKKTNVAKGPHTVGLTVDDGNGGTNSTSTGFTASNRAPNAAFTYIPTAPVGGNTLVFNGSNSSDPDGDGLTYAWDFDANGSVDAGGITANWPNVPTGTHGVSLTVSDGQAFASTNRTIVVALPPNVLPIADFLIAPNPANVGQSVTFDAATSKDPDLGGIVRYDWTFGDGSKATTTTPSAHHPYASGGSYTVTLKVTDNRGGVGTHAAAVKISPTPLPPNRPATAAFDFAPAAPVAGDTVTFTSTSTDADGQVTRLDWDFDGNGFYDATGATATHAYAGPGNYSVTLRAQDNRGDLSTVTRNVTVTGPQTTGVLALFGASSAPALRAISPFPIVRIRGRLTAHGARILLLTVRAPKGATVVAKCKGHGCPRGKAASQRAVVRRGGKVRIRAFERNLRSGTRLVIYVMQKGRIGKYTRFTIRAGKSPARKDLCVTGSKATRCPV